MKLQVRVKEKLWEEVESYCKRYNLSVSKMLREALKKYLRK